MKSTEELFEYCVQMGERGDSYRAMVNFLNIHCEEEKTLKDIVTAVNKLEKQKKISLPVVDKYELPMINKILGSLFLLSGAFLMFFLWGNGVIFTLPFILISLGVLALTGAIE